MADANISQIESESFEPIGDRLSDKLNDLNTRLGDIAAMADCLSHTEKAIGNGLSEGTINRAAWKIERDANSAIEIVEECFADLFKIRALTQSD